MKILDKLILSFYYIVVISITLLVALGSLYFIDLIFQVLPEEYNQLRKLVIYIYCGVILITLIIIIVKDIFRNFKKWLYKCFGHYDVSVHCLSKENECKFYVNWSKTSNWVRNNIEEIEIYMEDGFDIADKTITLCSNNEWQQTVKLLSNDRSNINYGITIRHFK